MNPTINGVQVSFSARQHVNGRLLQKVLSGQPLIVLVPGADIPDYHAEVARQGLVTNKSRQLFLLGLTDVQQPANPPVLEDAIKQQIAQLSTNSDVNEFFERMGADFHNPLIKEFPNLLEIPPTDRHGHYSHPNLLLSDLATDIDPKQKQAAIDFAIDNHIHHLVVTENFRAESTYTEQGKALLGTYYITCHAALWAGNLIFHHGGPRPPSSRVRLPASAWR